MATSPQSKERPILFSAPMVRAILDGWKTVTRRPVKAQPHSRADIGNYGKGQPFIRNPDVTKRNPECPFGNPGDRLWVRETWARVGNGDPGYLTYRATYPDCLPPDLENILASGDIRWKPSIHMFRRDSRILLEITDVRVERLQDISRADIRAEGLQCPPELASDDVSPNYRDWYPAAWKELWNSTGGDWDANPWVWVIEFKRVTP
ncbi:hypothetical protein DMX02_14965 [Pseudomonas jessenii]|nr:hypothetical protein DMX02_14965 [Pseudomonas jessenii]